MRVESYFITMWFDQTTIVNLRLAPLERTRRVASRRRVVHCSGQWQWRVAHMLIATSLT